MVSSKIYFSVHPELMLIKCLWFIISKDCLLDCISLWCSHKIRDISCSSKWRSCCTVRVYQVLLPYSFYFFHWNCCALTSYHSRWCYMFWKTFFEYDKQSNLCSNGILWNNAHWSYFKPSYFWCGTVGHFSFSCDDSSFNITWMVSYRNYPAGFYFTLGYVHTVTSYNSLLDSVVVLQEISSRLTEVRCRI